MKSISKNGEPMEQKKLLEAALFASPKPLDLNELGKIAGISSLGYLKDVLEELRKEYEGRGIEIVQTPEGWSMQVTPAMLPQVSHLTPSADLSEGCKRTLALVLYKEPARQSEIIAIQGNKAYGYIRELQKRSLIRAEKQGHTKILKVTQEFERYFGESKDTIRRLLSTP